ncbi:MAG: capsule biosynthesis protein [Endozoicomonas sp.]
MKQASVLFLQGPLGPFFKKLSEVFSQAGYITHKINFNGGDRFFAGGDYVVDYRGTPEQWRVFLRSYLVQHGISAVFLLGDCRYYHRQAKALCEQLNVAFMVFEEGYLRPNTVTLEPHGVNALSELDLSLDTIRNTPVQPVATPVTIGAVMPWRAIYASIYYWAAWLYRWRFPHYRHHRAFNPVREGFCWLRGFARKWLVKPTDKLVEKKLTGEFSGQFFLVPLQVHDDSQKIYHSRFSSVEAFIAEVMESFRENAHPSQVLCFKHHPMDRGYTHYGKLIDRLTSELGLCTRVFYCHDASLPLLYHHAAGVVTVNSTVGMSALLHRLPTKVTGLAMYDIEGLTHQDSLDSFWQAAQPVDHELFKQFYSLIFQKTQVNGSFFKLWDISCPNALAFYEGLMMASGRSSATSLPQQQNAIDDSQNTDSDIALDAA